MELKLGADLNEIGWRYTECVKGITHTRRKDQFCEYILLVIGPASRIPRQRTRLWHQTYGTSLEYLLPLMSAQRHNWNSEKQYNLNLIRDREMKLKKLSRVPNNIFFFFICLLIIEKLSNTCIVIGPTYFLLAYID